MKVTGNTILVTGGGTGIGRALSEALHAKGNQVIVAGRRAKVLEETVAQNPGMQYAVLDLDRADAIATFAEQIKKDFPSLNVVIHNAGVLRYEDVKQPKLADVDAMVTTNVLGPIRLTAALLPALLKQPDATIVTVSSGLAFVPLTATPTYCATKAAIHSYTESLRYQLQDTHVKVMELIPPYVQTELGGKEQAADPRAMPLAEFIDETISLISDNPDATEICVGRVLPLRQAPSSGNYAAFFKQFNDAMTGSHPTS